jgi:5-methylcytosine-specific restriction endonuclease McrBC regulatory subunit McrC
LKQLHKSLLMLQRKKIHQTLYKDIPASLPESQRTFTLFDWVGLEELNERKAEALQEMAELQAHNVHSQHSHFHSFILSLTHSLTHSLTYSLFTFHFLLFILFIYLFIL